MTPLSSQLPPLPMAKSLLAPTPLVFDLIQTFDTTQKLCAYPGMSLILNVTKSQCFEDVWCVNLYGNSAHHIMGTLRDVVLCQYGDLQVGVCGGIDTALRSTAYSPPREHTTCHKLTSLGCNALQKSPQLYKVVHHVVYLHKPVPPWCTPSQNPIHPRGITLGDCLI